MNIGLCTEMMNVGGAAALTVRQAKWLKEHGHNPVIFSAGGARLDVVNEAGIEHLLMTAFEPNKQWTPEQLTAEGALLHRAATALRLDVVLAQAQWPYSFAEAAVGAEVPVFFDLISPVYFPHKTAETQAFVQRAARGGRVLSGSTGDALLFASAFGIDARSIHVANLPISTPDRPARTRADVRRELGLDERELAVLTVARLDPDRAPMILPAANAVENLSTRLKIPMKYVVVGDGTEAANLRARSPRSTLYTGFRHDLTEIYHACDIFIGEGSVVQDAAACGLPVLITSTTAKAHLGGVVFSVFGLHIVDEYFTAPSNIVPLTAVEDALRLLVEFPEKRAEIAAAGTQLVREHWHIDSIMEKRLAIFANPHAVTASIAACRTAIEIEGGASPEVEECARLLASAPAARGLGALARKPVPWSRYFSMPLSGVQALSQASWRVAHCSAPVEPFARWREHVTQE